MKIITNKYTPWFGAIDTYKTIEEWDKVEEFEELIEELYPDGIDETALNDILWFEDEWLFEQLGIDTGEEEDE